MVDSSPPIDVTRMREAMGDEPEEFAEILDLYLESTSQNLALLEAAVTSADHDAIESLAHNCAGTSATCGMVAVVPAFRALEKAAREGSLDHAPALLAEAKKQFERICAFLKTELNTQL